MKSVAPCFCNRTCNKRTHLDFLSRIQINQTMKINLIVQIITAVISITVSFASNKFRCKLPITKRTIVQHYAPLQPSVFQDFMLPMRDGIKLHTVALSPLFSSKKQWPTVIDRSPYGQFNTSQQMHVKVTGTNHCWNIFIKICFSGGSQRCHRLKLKKFNGYRHRDFKNKWPANARLKTFRKQW